jgi:hypothetical protein
MNILGVRISKSGVKVGKAKKKRRPEHEKHRVHHRRTPRRNSRGRFVRS